MAINYLSGAGFANSRRMATDTADPAFSGFLTIDPGYYAGVGDKAPIDATTSNALHRDAMYDTATFIEGPQAYVASGYKWGSDGTFGTGGGEVTWSLAGSGWSNQSGSSEYWFSGTTIALSNFLNFDYVSVLNQAFAAWAAVANITFRQVSDGGGNMGAGYNGSIRISGAYMDGPSNTFAAAFQPVGSAIGGDMVFDSGESSWGVNQFLGVATHEIGHALGLRHSDDYYSLMYPYYNSSILTPQADDIAGIRTIYGPRQNAGSVYISNAEVYEGNGGTTVLLFTVTRTGGSTPFRVSFSTQDGSATSSSGDYVSSSAALQFDEGVNTGYVTVVINGDIRREGHETFYVNLTSTTGGAIIGRSQAVGTIYNDDANNAPALTVPAVFVTASAAQNLSLSSLFTGNDIDGDAIRYYFQDANPAANSGYFVVNGSAVANGSSFSLTAAQAAQSYFVSGARGVTDDIYVQATDGTDLSSLRVIHITSINHAPVLTIPSANVFATVNQTFSMASLFSGSDSDGDALRYYFHDGGLGANSGHFVVNGTVIANGADFSLTGAQLSTATFVTGNSRGTTDALYVQISDGTEVSRVGVINVSVPGNRAPVLTIPTQNMTVSPNQGYGMYALFSASDAEGDPLRYYFQDASAASDSGYFVVNGTNIANGGSFSVTAAQLGQTIFRTGRTGTADNLYVQVSDGFDVSSLGIINLAVPNRAPVLTIPSASVTASVNQTYALSSLFYVSDADGDALRYYLHDGGMAANSGHFVVNGSVIANGTDLSLTAAQWAQTTFVAGAQGSSDGLYVQVSDGKAVTSLGVVQVSVPANRAPVLTIPNANLTTSPNLTYSMSNLFTATDADGDALRYYFQDGSSAATSGYFIVNGTTMANGASFSVTAAQLSQVTFRTGAAGSLDDLYVQVSDSKDVSSLGVIHLNVPNHAPVLSIPSTNVTASTNQTFALTSLFTASDSDGDALRYYLHDHGLAANSGHFVVNGSVIANGADLSLTAAQMAQTTFVTGARGSSDDLYVQVSDGKAVTSLSIIHVGVPANKPPVLTIPSANVAANVNQTFSMASLFTGSDQDGDALRYYLQDAGSASTSGRFYVNGTAMANGASFSLTAAQLAQTTFVAGAVGSVDDIYVQISDGNDISSLGVIHLSVPNHAPVLSIPATVNAGANQNVAISSLFTASDADGDALRYYLHDAGRSSNGGHFVVNGSVIADGTDFSITSSQLAQTVFRTGAAGTFDDIYVQVSDGRAVTSLGHVQVNALFGVAAGGPLASTADHFVFAEDLGKKQYHVPGNELLDPGPGPVSGGGIAPLDTAGDPSIHTDAAIDLLTLFGKHAAGYAADHFTI